MQKRENRNHTHKERKEKSHEHRKHHKTDPEDDSRQRSKLEDHKSTNQVRNAEPPNHHNIYHATETPLGGDNDYVRRWLAETREEAGDDELDTGEQTGNPRKENTLTRRHPQLLHDAREDSKRQHRPSKQKRRHASSSDSSILEEPAKVSLRLREKDNERGLEASKYAPRPSKRQRTVSNASAEDHVEDRHDPKEVFEKRARHKTREDRYEPKEASKKEGKHIEIKRSISKREKKSDRRKAAKKAGEDLMNNFISKNIGQERLTIRPSYGPGLFKNGRASSPAKRRGLPDLAFSEMEFLQHSNQNLQAAKNDRITSKSREKELLKISRVEEEISTFFQSKKMPLTEINSNRGHSPSATMLEGCRYNESNNENHREQERERSQSYEPPLYRARDSSGINHTSDSSVKDPRVSLAVTEPEKAPITTGLLSEKATTYVSWSETQLSTEGDCRPPRLDTSEERPRSPTPESVRRSIENTGIYRGTGIDTRRGMNTSPGKSLKRRRHVEEQYFSHTTSKPFTMTSGSRNPSSTPQGSSVARNLSSENRPHLALSRGGTERSRSGESQSISEAKPSRSPPKRFIIQHFDEKLGWHQKFCPKQQRRHSDVIDKERSTPKELRSTPINREQIAKDARIKRPSTTVPITRIIGNVSNSLDADKSVMEHQHGTRMMPARADQPMAAASSTKLPDPVHFEAPGRARGSEGRLLSNPQRLNEQGLTQNQALLDYRPPAQHEQGVERLDAPQFLQLEASRNPNNGGSGEGTPATCEIQKSPTLLGLPLRGGWNHQANSNIDSSTHLSPSLEAQSLFIRQTQRDYGWGVSHPQRGEQQHIWHTATITTAADIAPALEEHDDTMRVLQAEDLSANMDIFPESTSSYQNGLGNQDMNDLQMYHNHSAFELEDQSYLGASERWRDEYHLNSNSNDLLNVEAEIADYGDVNKHADWYHPEMQGTIREPMTQELD
ncbi:hypothetical protein B0J14DRAFT_677846 [Halenospora varia]|nr:hypothetical protein B0J14DRAFT_677846 [Halenospora varia]